MAKPIMLMAMKISVTLIERSPRPSAVPGFLQKLCHLTPKNLIPILQTKKLKVPEVKNLAQNHAKPIKY